MCGANGASISVKFSARCLRDSRAGEPISLFSLISSAMAVLKRRVSMSSADFFDRAVHLAIDVFGDRGRR